MKTEAWWQDVERDPIHLAAVEWQLRLQDPNLSLEDTLAWQDWMKASPEHAEAFSRLEEISLAASTLHAPEKPRPREFESDRYDGSVPLSEWRRPIRPMQFLAVAASMLLALGLGAWIASGDGWRLGGSWRVSTKVLTTEVGENRTVPLDDGSRVILGGHSRIEVAFSKAVRAVELEQGEAFFVVAKDAARPFKVRAGGASVTAVGTEFNVRRESDRVVVAVTEGRVLVEPVSPIVPLPLLREFKPKLRAVRVAAGEETSAGEAGIENVSKVEDPSATTSWQSGRLAFRLQPLKYVIQDVNRYAPKPIVLDDDSIGGLVITGTVTRDNVTGWIGSLEHAFGLQGVEEPDQILLRRR